MKKSFPHFIPSLVVFALALAMADAARATLLVYEGFDYTNATTVAGQSGGTGWTATWATGSGTFLGTNVTGSLSYNDGNGHTLQTNGGSLVVGTPAGNSGTTATPNRTLPTNLSGGSGVTAGAGRTTWISLLYQRLNLNPGTLPFLRQANLGLFEGGGERVDIGGPNTGATVANVLSVWGSGTHQAANPFQAGGYPLTSNSTFFILIKVITDGSMALDTAYVWFNWTNLAVEPDISTATLTDSEVNLSSVNTLRFQAGNLNATGSNALFQVDELRVGTAFVDVAPFGTNAPPLAPAILSQPANTTVTIGDPATFTVNAAGTAPLFYQWYFNTNTPLLNQTNASLTIASAQTNDAGGYSVIVSNSIDSITSAVATLKVLPPAPPSILSQPANASVTIGDPATFTVSAAGTAPLFYQWYFNTNTPLLNQTNASLTIASTQTNDAGSYSVIVSNYLDSVTSTAATLVVIPPFERLPAFPGADGAAKNVSGGRGGLVYHVTKLDRNFNHAETGTLRYGLNDANFPAGVPRTIVFDVGGVFWLGRYGAESNYDNGWNAGQSRYDLPRNTTIAGQTAPGPVIIMGGVTKAGGTNMIIRNVMFAPGYGMQSFHEPPAPPTPGDFPDSYVYDALDISGQNIMIDHLTTLYTTDESISCNELAANLTIQNCNVSQGQNYPQADAEASGVSYTGHALAHLLQAGSNAKVSVLNNLYAHQKGRLPRVGSEVGTGAFNDFRNNVYYNWLTTAGTGATAQPSFNNFINNFYLAGPGGDNPVGGANSNLTTAAGGTGIFNGTDASATRAYAAGNLKDINKNGDPNDTVSADGDFISTALQSTAYNIDIGVTLTASNAFRNVLRYVGSRWWERDFDFALNNTNAINSIDERLIHETYTGTGKIIAWADDPFNDDPNEGVEWRSLLALRADTNTFAAPFNRPVNWDTDGDGMPDYWELEHGLNPNVADNNGDFDHDGYSNLEEYLNDIAAWPAPGVIAFIGATNNRYAEIFNWQVSGATVSIAGTNVVTSSRWQPSRYDTALISNSTVVVDAVGQHAGSLRLAANATLNITNGWLKVADTLDIGAACTTATTLSGSLEVASNLVNSGTLRLIGQASLNIGGTFTNNGLLDIMTWNGTLPAGFVNRGTVLDHSSIRIDPARVNGSDFEATIQSYSGHSYQLQYRDDLSSGTWGNIGPAVTGNGAPITLIHSAGASAQLRFYRVAVDL